MSQVVRECFRKCAHLLFSHRPTSGLSYQVENIFIARLLIHIGHRLRGDMFLAVPISEWVNRTAAFEAKKNHYLPASIAFFALFQSTVPICSTSIATQP